MAYAAYAYWARPVAFAAKGTALVSAQPGAAPTLAWPSTGETAIGAVGYGVLAQHTSGKPLATASSIKLLTALAVLRMKPFDTKSDGPVIVLTQADVNSYAQYVAGGGSVVRVTAGEQLTERQALEALLLPSANNIAETLARWAFGSVDAYLSYANGYSKQLGMPDTTVTDPSGFLGTTTSTPHDLTVLGEAVMAQPVIVQIVQEKSAIIPVQGTIRNVNVLLGQDGIIGLKTGNNNQDPGCFIFAADITIGGQPVTLIGAIMGAPTLGAALWDALPLIDSARNGFHKTTIATAGVTIQTLTTPWGDRVPVAAKTNLIFPTWGNSTTKTLLDIRPVRAPVHEGATIGTLVATNTLTRQQYSTDLVLQKSLSEPGLLWRLWHYV